MGSIQKKSFLSTSLLGVGLLLGFVTSSLLLPEFFTKSENGIINLLLAYSQVFSQIALLGIPTMIMRYFPHFRDEVNRNNNFLTVVSMLTLLGFLIFVVVFLGTRPFLTDAFTHSPFYLYLIPLTFFTVYYYVFEAYSAAQHKPVRGFFLKDVLQRVLIIGLIAAYAMWVFRFDQFILCYTVLICLPTIIFFFLLWREKQFTTSFRTNHLYREHGREMARVSGFSLLLGISWVGINYLDQILIGWITNDLEKVGIYGRVMYFGTLVAVPYRAVHKATSGPLAAAFKNGDMQQVRAIYYKSCINQLVLACFILGGVWLNINNIFRILPESYSSGKYVILFIGLGNLFTMMGGVNTGVITYSPYYRWNTYFVAFMLVFVFLANLLLIPVQGIIGAAVATASAIFLYNLLMYFFLWYHYKFQPFSWRMIVIIAVSAGAYLASAWIPWIGHLVPDIVVRSFVFTFLFAVLVLGLRLSPDINDMVRFLLRKGLGFVGLGK